MAILWTIQVPQMKKEEDVFSKKLVGIEKISIEIEIPSVHIVTMTPFSLPTQVGVAIVSTFAQLDDDEVDTQSLISSLSMLFVKNKFVKSLEKTLSLVLDHLDKIVTITKSSLDIQQ